jgi:hypothetical protein
MRDKSQGEATATVFVNGVADGEAQTSTKQDNGSAESVYGEIARKPTPHRKLVDGNWVSSTKVITILPHE